MYFTYTGKDNSGKKVEGSINATTKSNAEELLNKTGINITTLDLAESKNLTNKIFIFNAPKTIDLIIFAKQMHSLLRAGVAMTRSLNIVSSSCKNEKLSITLANIANKLENGYSLGFSMEKYPKIFPKLVTALISIGEQTGNLSEIFERIAINLHKDNEIKKGVKTAMRYPTLVIIAITIAMFIINIVVIPSFSKFFANFKAKLPLPTQILMATSDFSVKYWWIIILLVIAAIGTIIKFINTPNGRYLWDKYKIKLPILGSILERSLLSQFARSFSLCFKSGVPLLEALTLIANTCNNSYMESKILEIKNRIEHGESMTIAAKSSGIFNGLVLQMILIGEESGELDRLLTEVSLFYDEELDYDIKNISSLIEPILIGIMSTMVLILALGIFLPMWSLSQSANGL